MEPLRHSRYFAATGAVGVAKSGPTAHPATAGMSASASAPRRRTLTRRAAGLSAVGRQSAATTIGHRSAVRRMNADSLIMAPSPIASALPFINPISGSGAVINSPLLRKFIRRDQFAASAPIRLLFGRLRALPAAARRAPRGPAMKPVGGGRTLEIGASGLTSGEGKRSDCQGLKRPRPSSSFLLAAAPE